MLDYMVNKMNKTYKNAGVDIELANRFIVNKSKDIKTTYTDNVLRSKNNFCGLYDISKFNYKHPILVSTIDGVGSKIKLAIQHKGYYGIGLDVVFNNVNDIICSGATPLLFLDYYGVGRLELDTGNEILDGIIDGCLEANISLMGGETAELPLTYKEDDFELVGTCIGMVDKEQLYLPENIHNGDILIGITSSGPHSNGYSLINSIITEDTPDTIIEALLKPTKNYSRYISQLYEYVDIKGCANITGGGLTDNIPRILPNHLSALIDLSSYYRPDIFNWIQSEGNILESEMQKVFNLGIGMVICISEEDLYTTTELLGEEGVILGQVIKNSNNRSEVYYV